MTGRARRRIWGVLALGLAPALGSCAAPATIVATAGLTAVQAGGAAYINGELESANVVPIGELYQVVLDTLGSLQFPVTYKNLRERNAYIYARESSGRKIKVFLEKRSPVVTKINIRIGVWGDQAISRLLLGEIQARCPAVPQAESPTGDPRRPVW